MLTNVLLTATLAAAPASAESDRVIVFILDGIRAVDLLETAHYDSPILAPLYERGVLMTGLQNLGPTATEPAHRTMLSGQYQPHTNLPWYEERDLQRAFSPVVFEEVYVQTGKTGAITGNSIFMDSQASSIYPGHEGRWIERRAGR